MLVQAPGSLRKASVRARVWHWGGCPAPKVTRCAARVLCDSLGVRERALRCSSEAEQGEGLAVPLKSKRKLIFTPCCSFNQPSLSTACSSTNFSLLVIRYLYRLSLETLEREGELQIHVVSIKRLT